MAVSLADIGAKLEAGDRLSDSDIEALEGDRDIVALGMLADGERRKRHGGRVTYGRVFDLAGALTADVPSAAGEIRIVAKPDSLATAVSAVSAGRDLAAAMPLSGFSLSDLEQLSEPLPVVLVALKDAGLELVAFAPLDKLMHPEHSLEAVTDAGLKIARVTIDEAPSRRWSDVCRQVGALQRRLQSLQTFAPLPRFFNLVQPTTGYQDVKRIALARLLVENVDTIQLDWNLYGPKLAQVALIFGANDIDAVSAEDDQSQGRRRSPVEEIHRNIQAAGFEPVERNARFETV